MKRFIVLLTIMALAGMAFGQNEEYKNGTTMKFLKRGMTYTFGSGSLDGTALLTLKALTGSTIPIFNVVGSAGTSVFSVSATGAITMTGTFTPGAIVTDQITSPAASDLTITAVPDQFLNFITDDTGGYSFRAGDGGYYITADNGATDVDFEFIGKGDGHVRFRSGQGGITLEGVGTATDVPITITSKGTGDIDMTGSDDVNINATGGTVNIEEFEITGHTVTSTGGGIIFVTTEGQPSVLFRTPASATVNLDGIKDPTQDDHAATKAYVDLRLGRNLTTLYYNMNAYNGANINDVVEECEAIGAWAGTTPANLDIAVSSTNWKDIPVTTPTGLITYTKSFIMTATATGALNDAVMSNAPPADPDWSNATYVDMWLRLVSTSGLGFIAGDVKLAIVDSVAGTTYVNIGAIAAGAEGTWVPMAIDISAVPAASRDDVTEWGFAIGTATARAFALSVDRVTMMDPNECLTSVGAVPVQHITAQAFVTAAWTAPTEKSADFASSDFFYSSEGYLCPLGDETGNTWMVTAVYPE